MTTKRDSFAKLAEDIRQLMYFGSVSQKGSEWANRLDALVAEQADDARDAARYRVIRDDEGFTSSTWMVERWGLSGMLRKRVTKRRT